MSLSIGLFVAIGKPGYHLYAYFFKGPRIDAALIYQSSGKKSIELSAFNNMNSMPLEQDLLRRYEIFGNYILTLKNNSLNTAYNIRLLNAPDIFNSFDRIEPLAHLEPGKTIQLKVRFSYHVEMREHEADKAPAMPEEVHNKPLDIVYQNEARTNFYTRFKISDRTVDNTYFLKLPKD